MNGQFLILLFAIRFAFSAMVAEYQFITNFGSMLYDYSGNGMHGANSGTIPTDRGAYFSGTSSSIILPPNAYVASNLVLGSTFTITMWVNLLSSSDCYFYYRSDNKANYLYIQYKGGNFVVQLKNNPTAMTPISVSGKFITGI